MKEDPRISIDYIATTLDISYGSADRILKQYLGLRKVSSTANHVKLHHDKARPHMNNVVFSYLQEKKIKVIPHPPYSPDLTPSDFWLFNRLKRNLDEYPDAKSLAKALSKELNSIPIEEYQKTFKKWIERMKLCIQHDGDYFEHLL